MSNFHFFIKIISYYNMKTYYNYVIYHKKCPDGFTGFFILHQSGLIHKNASLEI
jgi:hypothetical protein